MENDELQMAFGGGLKAFGAGPADGGGAAVPGAALAAAVVTAAIITLLYGLLLTAGFRRARRGPSQPHLHRLLSVLYVGLGIDYALYLCMQYRELLGGGMAQREALPRAAADVGGFMVVCAATTSLGFFAFIPTPFTAIAELGLIAGAGMFISLIVEPDPAAGADQPVPAEGGAGQARAAG